MFEKKPRLLTVSIEDEAHTHLLRALHTHDDRVEILLIRKGCGRHTVDGNLYQTRAGDIIIYNAHALHDEDSAKEEGMEILSCSVADVKLFGLQLNCLISNSWCPVIQDGYYSAEVESLLLLLYTTKREPEKISIEVKEYLLYSLLIILQSAAKRYAGKPQIKEIELGHRIQHFIDDHYKEDITLDDIAAGSGINKYYLSRVFKTTIGYSPMQYVIRRRIGEAQSWLLMTDKSVTEIAYLVGYNSAGNFNNAFHRLVGMTPQNYRKHWKK